MDQRHCMWAGNDEAGNLSQPRQFGAAKASTYIGAEDDDEEEGEPLTKREAIAFWAVMASPFIAIAAAYLFAALTN